MKLREIERLRALAVLMVVVHHWSFCHSLLIPELRESWSGVDLFFVISGYVVTLSLVRLLPSFGEASDFAEAFARAKGALKTFYTRRFFRILPAALAVILLSRLAIDFFPAQFGTTKGWLDETIAFLAGIYNYVVPVTGNNVIGVYWSLSVEEHFYLILPVLFVTLRTTGRRVLACVVVILLIALVLRPFGHPDGPVKDILYYERFSSHLRFDSLMAGVAIALLKTTVKAPVLPRWFVRFCIVPVCLGLVWMMPGAAPVYVVHREGFIALWAISGILVAFAGADRGYVLDFPIVGRVLEYIGARSYAIYLLHFVMKRLDEGIQPLWPAYKRVITDGDGGIALHFVILFAALLVACETLYRVVEAPLIAFGRQFDGNDPGKPVKVGRLMKWGAATIGLCAVVYYFHHSIESAFGPKNIARGKAVTTSSRDASSRAPDTLTNGSLESERGVATAREDAPWEQIDLGEPTPIREIRVFNRADGWQTDALPLELLVSTNGTDFELAGRREKMFTQAWPWRFGAHGVHARYVRLRVPLTSVLCLTEVEVYEEK